MKKFAFLSMFLIYCLFFGFLPKATACGPFSVDPVFSLTRHADYPLGEYTNGKNGIVPESFGRMSLFVFYRQLNGLSFTANEQKQVEAALKERIEGYHPDNDNSASETPVTPDYFQKWKDARAKVLPGETKIETEKRLPDEYSYFSNCLGDAFSSAAETLEERVAKFGTSDNVKEWLSGQDAVFSNCSETGKMPEPLGENFPEWLRRDREYQIAAALFYKGDNAGARAKFEQIAADSNSPWSKTARFVAARTFIRQASFIDVSDSAGESVSNADAANSNSANGNSGSSAGNADSNSSKEKKLPLGERKKEKAELLRNAETRLQSILTDASMNAFQPSAQRLLGLVMFRSNASQRQSELARILAAPAQNQNIYNDLIDYIWLLDPVESAAHETGEKTDAEQAEKNNLHYDYAYRLKIRDVPANRRAEDLTDWLFTYQAQDGFAHAFEKWSATGKLHWFVCALTKTEKNSPQLSEILTEAAKIKPNSPAFATIRFHQVRLLLENGNIAEARNKLAEIFSNNLKEFPASTQNKFLAQRTVTAENLNEFLKFAQRRAAAFVWSDDADENDDDLKNNENLKPWKNRPMFDEDAAAFMNERMPLSALRQAALSPQLPEHLKKFLVVAVWTRAYVLGNQTIEREFTPLVQRYAPEFSPLFSKYANAPNATEREAAALLSILNYPVLQPFVPVGYGREDSKPLIIDSIRGNWWCVASKSEDDSSHYDVYGFKYPSVSPNFLTKEETEAAKREKRQMIASGNSATFLTQRALEFAERNPNHEQTPEILHLAVRSTRYGCTDEATKNLSKQAFQILHKSYPNSPWTKKTPYWFGQ